MAYVAGALTPGGGPGPPTAILDAPRSHTARFLRDFLNGNGQSVSVS